MPQADYLSPLLTAVIGGLLWLTVLAAALKLLGGIWHRLLGRCGEARVGSALARLLPEVRNDLIVPDGRGGLTQIDHLALTPAGLLAVETKTYRGVILGQAREATWTQVIGRRRRSFQNPLRQNFAHTQALEALNPAVPVHGLVVFAGPARFPKGLPAGACHISTLPVALSVLREGPVSEELRAAWTRVLAQARTDGAARRAHLAGLRGRFDGIGSSLAWRLLLLVGLLPLLLWPLLPQPKDHPQHPSAASVPATPAYAEWTPAPVPQTSVRPASTALRRSAGTVPERPAANIEWAQPSQAEADRQACALAVAAALIDNSLENRRSRDQACE